MKGAFFDSSEEELQQFLIPLGNVSFDSNSIRFDNYPFGPSIVTIDPLVKASDIINISTKSYRPTIRIGNELIFIHAAQREVLARFAEQNNIQLVDRPELWDWILEPFLDTEFTNEDKQRLYGLLLQFHLSRADVDGLRARVKGQMMKYNFDTMLWEWQMFSALDVLKAMRPKLSAAEFKEFYKEVMEIALRPDVNE